MKSTEKVKINKTQECTTIIGIGALDLYNEDFCTLTKEESLTAENLVIDLRLSTFIDTAILASLAGAASRMLKRNKRLKVIFTKGTHPLRTFMISGLSEIMDNEVEDAKKVE